MAEKGLTTADLDAMDDAQLSTEQIGRAHV